MSGGTALVTGARGQDGVHLARLLLEQDYQVIGTTRDLVADKSGLDARVKLASWDPQDEAAFAALITRVRPTEVYNFAAYSSGAGMFEDPVGVGEINGLAVTRMLEAIRRIDPAIRFLQASSSEMFGEAGAGPLSEKAPFAPRSPYGAAKLYAHQMVGVYRRHYGLFACSAILFNHESPFRGLGFATRKISDGAARIKLGMANDLSLGNLEARRDWGFAGDYVRGAWLMLQASAPEDYVLATGRTHSIRDLCRHAFEHVGLDYRDYVREDAASLRPIETGPLVGDASKAARQLDWSPTLTLPELVRAMVEADIERLSRPAKQTDGT